MKRDIFEVYVVTVSFLALLTVTIFLGVGLYNLVKVWQPELMMEEYTFTVHQTNEKFARTYLRSHNTPLPADDEITRLREESYRVAVQSEKRSALQTLILSGIALALAGTVVGIHWGLFVKIRRKIE